MRTFLPQLHRLCKKVARQRPHSLNVFIPAERYSTRVRATASAPASRSQHETPFLQTHHTPVAIPLPQKSSQRFPFERGQVQVPSQFGGIPRNILPAAHHQGGQPFFQSRAHETASYTSPPLPVEKESLCGYGAHASPPPAERPGTGGSDSRRHQFISHNHCSGRIPPHGNTPERPNGVFGNEGSILTRQP